MDKDKKNPDTLGRCQDLNISCKARTRHKDSQYLTDEQVVKMQFRKYPQTMLMASHATGIERADICRYIAKWRKTDSVAVVFKSRCKISKELNVQYFTTSPEMIEFVKNRKRKELSNGTR